MPDTVTKLGAADVLYSPAWLWKWGRLWAAVVAGVWVGASIESGFGAWLVGFGAFAIAWIALTLAGVAVRHPWAAFKWTCILLLAWGGLSALTSLPVHSLLVVVVILLLFR